jgi:hypothetical protein
MTIHIDGETDLFTVLSRLSGSYAKLVELSAPRSSVPLTLSSNGIALVSAFGSSCE